MTDKKHVLRLSKDCFNRADISQEYFSPLDEFSAANVHFYSPIECFSMPKNESPNNDPNNNMFETPEKVFERNKNEVSPNDSNPTYFSEMNFLPPKYCNNVSPAIEKLMRKMTPSSSTPKNSQTPTKRVFSFNCWLVDQANEDPASCTPIRKRLDANLLSPRAFTSQEYSLDSSTLKATLVKEIEPLLIEPQIVQISSKCQECVDYFPDDERADSPRAGSSCEVKRVALIYRFDTSHKKTFTMYNLYVGYYLCVRGSLFVDGVQQESPNENGFAEAICENSF